MLLKNFLLLSSSLTELVLFVYNVVHVFGLLSVKDAMMWTIQVTNHKTSPLNFDIITYLVQEV